jgi:Leucine-rich repeat (LRR) protein
MFADVFPDTNFRNEVLRLINIQDGGSRIPSTMISAGDYAALAAIDTLNLNNLRIESLSGIEHFTGLHILFCRDNQLTELDMSGNPAFQMLFADGNQLTTLNLSSNPALSRLSVSRNQLTSLDVTNNPALTTLTAYDNQLIELDVTNNIELIQLILWNNNLSELDLSSLTELQQLYIDNNQLIELIVSNNTELRQLDASNNNLTELYLNNNTKLLGGLYDNGWFAVGLNISNNQITKLDLSNNTALRVLDVSNNQLTELDVSKNTELMSLKCSDNNLTELDVSNNKKLSGNVGSVADWTWSGSPGLDVGGNFLTELDVSKNTELIILYVGGNQLTELNISNNNALRVFLCKENRLTSLDVSNNTALQILNINHNFFYTLDISNNLKLLRLECSYNYFPDRSAIIGLDESRTTIIFFPQRKFSISIAPLIGGSITAHDSTSANPKIDSSDPGRPILLTVIPDEGYRLVPGSLKYNGIEIIDYRFTMPAARVTITAEFAIAPPDSFAFAFPDVNFRAHIQNVVFGGNRTDNDIFSSDDKITLAGLTSLNVSNMSITDLTGIEYFIGLTTLNCNRNRLTKLDVSKNTALQSLNAGWNQLNTLDVSNNTALISLDLANSQLNTLDVSNNTALIHLDLHFNQLTELDVSNNTALWRLTCSYNQLTELDVSKNIVLVSLTVYNNQLTHLDISNNTSLVGLKCFENYMDQNPDIGVPGWQNLFSFAGSDWGSAFTYFPQNTPPVTQHPITIAPLTNGIITANRTIAAAGTTIALTITPDVGYRLKEGTLRYNGVRIRDNTFIMPVTNVTVTAEFESPAKIVGDVLDDLLNNLDTDDLAAVNAAVDEVRNMDLDTLTIAMQTSEDVLLNIDLLEQAFMDVNNITVEVEIPQALAEIFDDGRIEIIGAGLNAASGTVTLNIVPSLETVAVNENRYERDSLIRLNITLTGTGVTPAQLAVPVWITVPVPTGFTPERFRILHYEADGINYNLITPRLNNDGTASFVLTRFSEFVFVELTSNVLWGDVNDDGRVDGSDVQALVLWINAGRPPGVIDEVAARISSAAGRPDGSDVQALVLWINAGGNALIGHPGPNP